MTIKELIELQKFTKDKRLIDDIVKYYEPNFCNLVIKYYGKEYVDISKKVLPIFINYYFDKNLKVELSVYLINKVKSMFVIGNNYEELINSDNSKLVIFHYIYYMHNKMLENNVTDILSKEDLFDLCEYDVVSIYNNYVKSPKNTKASFYFLKLIERNLEKYKSEEVLLLTYAKKIKVTDKIREYFYKQYEEFLYEYCFGNERCYKKSIDNALEEKVINIFTDFKPSLIRQIKNYKSQERNYIKNEIEKVKNNEQADILAIKEYYSYIKTLIFNNFCDDVVISKDELIRIINIKYEDYFNAGIKYIINSKDNYLARYINSRLRSFLIEPKYLYKTNYVDEDNNTKKMN